MSTNNVTDEDAEGEEGEEGEDYEGEEEEEDEEEGESGEDGSDDELNYFKEDLQKNAIKLPLYTPEDLIAKEKRRLARSKCCLKEIWSFYSKLIDPLGTNRELSVLKKLEALLAAERDDIDARTESDMMSTIQTLTSSTTITSGRNDTIFSNLDWEPGLVTSNVRAKSAYTIETAKATMWTESNILSLSSVDSSSTTTTNTSYSDKISNKKSKRGGDIEVRMRRLQKKHELFKICLDMIKEAASEPFMRIDKPQFLDETDGRNHLLQVARTQRREIDLPDNQPMTLAVPRRHMYVANTNFDLFPIEKHRAWTQTVESGSMVQILEVTDSMESFAESAEEYISEKAVKNLSQDSTLSTAGPRHGEEFDYQDYPLEDGNPLGKTTGICHYCKDEILPFPPPYLLNCGLDPNQFYCCQEYRKMHEEIDALETKLRNEMETKHARIDIRPNDKHDPKHSKFPGFAPIAKPGTRLDSAPGKLAKKSGKDDGSKALSAAEAKQRMIRQSGWGIGGDDDEEGGKKPRRKTVGKFGARSKTSPKTPLSRRSSFESPSDPNLRHKMTSTFDFPWDPYETFYGHERLFKAGEHYKPSIACYEHALVVLTQDELYDKICVDTLSGPGSPGAYTGFPFESRGPLPDIITPKTSATGNLGVRTSDVVTGLVAKKSELGMKKTESRLGGGLKNERTKSKTVNNAVEPSPSGMINKTQSKIHSNNPKPINK